MKVHLHQIPQGLTLHIEEELDPAFLELKPSDARPTSPVRAAVDAGLSGGGLFATGSLAVDVEMTCVACLEKFQTTLSVPDFATQIELDGRESVDLTPQIREDILLVLPSHPRCDADGGKKCPASFQSAPAEPLTDDADHSAWEALDDFKPKN